MEVDLNEAFDFTYIENDIKVEDWAKNIRKSSTTNVEDYMNTSDLIENEIENKLVVGSIVETLDQVILLYFEYV